jgi:eukaryotic-like serine/threonine-protein kinase
MPHPGMENETRASPSDPEHSGERSFAQIDPRLEHLPAHLEVRRILGEGGSSVVYEAFHARLKVAVAVKVLSVHNLQARQRMSREAELYALLEDPRIPRVYDVNDLPDGTPYVVMEMVPGQSLEELLQQRGALDAELAISITKQVLATLASVHERGVLHRDIKPANVIMNFAPDAACQVRLVDFGIAKMPARAAQDVVTQRGSLIGTPQYMAPERLVGEEADSSADTYAAGVMLYEMLAGAPPFEGTSVSAVVVSVLREQPKPLLARRPDVSPALEQLVARAMARDPARRFASASEMLEALERIERERTSLVSVLEAPPTHSAPRARAGGEWLLLALLVATLGVAFGARWYQQTHAEPLRVSAPAPANAAQVEAPPLTVAPIEWTPRAPRQAASDPVAAEQPTAPTADDAEEVAWEERPEDVASPPAASALSQPATPPADAPERPISAPAGSGFDYAKLLPENPY